MIRKLLITMAIFLMLFNLTACSNESTSPTATKKHELFSDDDLDIIQAEIQASENSQIIEIGRGIENKIAKQLLTQLPDRTRNKADALIIQYSPLAPKKEYWIVAVWQENQKAARTEIWKLSLDKSVRYPMYTIRVTDDQNADIFAGFNEDYLVMVDGEVNVVNPEKVTMEQICEVTVFIENEICPILSLIPPYGSVICGAIGMFNYNFC